MLASVRDRRPLHEDLLAPAHWRGRHSTAEGGKLATRLGEQAIQSPWTRQDRRTGNAPAYESWEAADRLRPKGMHAWHPGETGNPLTVIMRDWYATPLACRSRHDATVQLRGRGRLEEETRKENGHDQGEVNRPSP